jgi:hypothetical protein
VSPLHRPAEEPEKQREPPDDVAAVLGQGLVPQRVQGREVDLALLERGRVQPRGQHAAAAGRVGPGPQQVAEQQVLPGPGELAAEQFAAEAAVDEVQVVAVVVTVPHPGAQQDGVARAQRLPAGQRHVRRLARDHEGDLHEAVRVHRVRLVVVVVPGVGQRAVVEVEDVPAGVHRELVVGELVFVRQVLFRHPVQIPQKFILC